MKVVTTTVTATASLATATALRASAHAHPDTTPRPIMKNVNYVSVLNSLRYIYI